MFQCAAAIGYAKKHGVQWVCPTDTKEVPRFQEYFPGLPIEDFWHGERYEAHDPSTFNYNEIPHFPHGIKLIGFFQSEKYFMNAHDEVREAFKLKHTEGYENSMSLHIRLGDYVQHSQSFPPIGPEYIREALKKIPHVVDKRLVFSDDISGARAILQTYFPHLDWTYIEGQNEFEDMSLMASCRYNVIANSTFSWWSAWLNQNENKVIVSPHHTSWFGPNGPTATQDLIPDGWEQIKFR